MPRNCALDSPSQAQFTFQRGHKERLTQEIVTYQRSKPFVGAGEISHEHLRVSLPSILHPGANPRSRVMSLLPNLQFLVSLIATPQAGLAVMVFGSQVSVRLSRIACRPSRHGRVE